MANNNYHDKWYRNMHALRSLLNATVASGDARIRDDYVALGDIYHALGACRMSTAFAGIAVISHVGIYYVQYGHHLYRSIAATIICIYIAALWLRVVQHNRDDTLHTMRRQLRRDLRIWITKNPSYLVTHPDVREEVERELEAFSTPITGDQA